MQTTWKIPGELLVDHRADEAVKPLFAIFHSRATVLLNSSMIFMTHY